MEFNLEHKKFILEQIDLGSNYSEIARDIATKFNYFDEYSHRTIRGDVSAFLNKSLNKGNQFKTPGTHIVLGCIHAPWHNKTLTDGITKLIGDLGNKVKGFHIIGDGMDINSLSSHDRGKKPLPGVDLGWEYEESNKLFDQFDSVLPENVSKSYLWGNHEDRYRRHMAGIDASKYGDSLVGPTQGARLLERGYNVQEDWINDSVTLGNHLRLMHGEFINIHTAHKHMQTFDSVMFVHTHRAQSFSHRRKAAYNIGCVVDIDSPILGYARASQKDTWSNGFALVDIDSDGFFHVTMLSFFNDRFYYNGKKY